MLTESVVRQASLLIGQVFGMKGHCSRVSGYVDRVSSIVSVSVDRVSNIISVSTDRVSSACKCVC